MSLTHGNKTLMQRAIQWIHANHVDGNAVPITHRNRNPYPEVTGYFIPTLLAIGEVVIAEQFARWLVTVQNANGSFSLDSPQREYVFDTGQVIRGWVAIIDRLPELREPLRRACDWIAGGINPATGALKVPPPGGDWSLGQRGEVSEGIHLYVLKPLRDAAAVLDAPAIRSVADRALAYYLAEVPVTDFRQSNMLTHFYGYMQEALCELGLPELARKGMASVAAFQQENGAVTAYYDVPWVCSTGLAQLAIVWYLLDDLPRADRAIAFVAQLQNASGGFYGSYGVGATYFPAEEIAWAVKYAIEAEQLRIARHFDHTAHHYAPTIPVSDGRVQAILGELGQARRVLDAGCGKGRYAALVKAASPATEVHAIDVSAEMLRHVSPGIATALSTIQDLPFPDCYFDLVYCVEALEHVPNPRAALTEMARVLVPGGRMVIVDKNLEKQGVLQIETWERWFGVEDITKEMAALGLTARSQLIDYDGRTADGLFVAWTGVKPAVVTNVNFYRNQYFDEHNSALVDACRRGDRAWIAGHLTRQDKSHPQPHADELYKNRVGMQLISQILQKAGVSFDVVDVACGNAMLLRKLRADGHRIQGVDASSERVANNTDLPILHGFGEALPLADQVADVVISLEAMAHVFDLDRALRECLRVARVGGLFLCQVPLGNFADGPNHVRLFSAVSLRAAVEGVGFETLGMFQIPYMVDEAPNNLFIAARRAGGRGAADVLAWVFDALAPKPDQP